MRLIALITALIPTMAAAELQLHNWTLIGDVTFPATSERFAAEGLPAPHRCTYKKDDTGALMVLWMPDACAALIGTES